MSISNYPCCCIAIVIMLALQVHSITPDACCYRNQYTQSEANNQ